LDNIFIYNLVINIIIMKLEKPEIHYNALDVLANQIVGMTLEYGEVDIDFVGIQ